VKKSKIKFELKADLGKEGIWRYASFLTEVPEPFQLTLGEGKTGENTLEETVSLKREDQNPTGSVKDRGMSYLVSWAYSGGKKDLVLSSSGNAAIAAAKYSQIAGINLYAFVAPSINPGKLKKLEELKAKIFISPRPVSEAMKFSQKNNFLNLRPSRSEFGSEGYQTIAFELAEKDKLPEDIFIPVSSGVMLLGIFKGFKKLGYLPKVQVCQSAAVYPIASFFTNDFQAEEKSLAEALVAKFSPLRNQVIAAVKESKGSGWIINNQEILACQRILEAKGITTSEEGALAVAAWQKAKQSNWPVGETVCLLTGRKY